jgi:hypothetical protein
MVGTRGWIFPGVFGIVCLLAIGCGPTAAPVAEKVEGTLTWGDVPLAGVRVRFVPQVEPGIKAPISSAITDEKGFFRLLREDTGKPGAVIGKHKVVFTSGGRVSGGGRPPKDGESPEAEISTTKIPPIYSSLNQTPFEIDVTPNQVDYKLVLKDL